MLALTRRKNEAIIIDGNIEIKILEVKGDKVKIGIEAPKDVSVHREEIYRQIIDNNQEAAKNNLSSMKKLNEIMSKL